MAVERVEHFKLELKMNLRLDGYVLDDVNVFVVVGVQTQRTLDARQCAELIRAAVARPVGIDKGSVNGVSGGGEIEEALDVGIGSGAGDEQRIDNMIF